MAPQAIKRLTRHRWLIWGILCLAYIIVFFHRLAIGVVKPDLAESFNISATAFANLSSAYFYAYLLMQVPTGVLVDTLGVRLTVAGGMILASIGSILFGAAPNIYVAFVGRVLVGIGVSVVFVSILKIQTQWFYEKEFATMSGLTAFIGNTGGIFAQTPLVLLVALLTWRQSFILIGVITLVVALVCFKLVRNSPVDIGLPSIREIEGKEDETGTVNVFSGIKKVCGNRLTWPPFFMFAGFYGAFHTLTGVWGQSYLKSVYGMSDITAANYIVISVIGFSAASLLIGRFSDRIFRRKLPLALFGTAYLLAWAALVFWNAGKPPVEILWLLFFALGFFAAAFVLGWACGKEVNDPKYAGLSVAVVNTGGFLGAALLPVIVGRVMDKYEGILSARQIYDKAFLICLIGVAVGYLFMLLIKETGCRNIGNQRGAGN